MPATERAVLADRTRAILTVAYERRALVRVPAAVLASVCRGPRFDAAVNHLLHGHGIVVCELSRPIAQQAGEILHRRKLSSQHAIDAFVVATALTFESAVIATSDPKDLRGMASPYRQIQMLSL